MTEPEKYTVGRSFRRALRWLFILIAAPFVAGFVYQIFVMVGVINDPLPPKTSTSQTVPAPTTTQLPADNWEPITEGTR